METTYSRPNKLSDHDTVLYEIYMLRFTAAALTEGKYEKDAWVYLESFLAHFRNLIEFLSKESERYGTDLFAIKLWQQDSLPEEVLKPILPQAKALWEAYESKYVPRISEYLAHCTTTRREVKDWPVSEMYGQIEPMLTEVEKCLKPSDEFRRTTKPTFPISLTVKTEASTAVSTNTARTTDGNYTC